MSSEKLLHPAGGSTLRAGFPARSRSEAGEKAVDVVERRHPSAPETCRKLIEAAGFPQLVPVDSGENAERAEFGSAPALQVVAGDCIELVERLLERFPQQTRSRIRIGVGAALGLRDDAVDHAELEAVHGIGLECSRGLLRLARVAPENRRAALRRD